MRRRSEPGGGACVGAAWRSSACQPSSPAGHSPLGPPQVVQPLAPPVRRSRLLTAHRPGVGWRRTAPRRSFVPLPSQPPNRPLPAARRYILQTYARPDIVFTHGEGARMYDAYGKEYLDFAAGIAVNALGGC